MNAAHAPEVPTPAPAVQRATLAVVCVTTAMLMLDIAVVNTALPAIATDLRASMTGLQWVVDAYTLALAAVVLSAGSLADRSGRRRVFTGGLVLFTVASAACAWAPGIWWLDGARAVQGLGGAVLFACSLALLADAYPSMQQRAGALAAYGATIGGSFAVGPLLGGMLTQHVDWRAIFLLNVPVGLVTWAVTARWVRESKDSNPRGLDVPGQVLAALGLGLLIFGLMRGNVDGWTSGTVLASFGGAALSLGLFVAVEALVEQPMLPLQMFANRAFTGAQLAAFAISSSMFAVFVYCTFYLQGVLHLTPVEAGLAYLPGTVVMFFVAGATAQIGKKVSPAVTLAVSLVLVAAGLLVMGLTAQVDSSRWAMTWAFMLACVGAGVFNPVMSGLVLGESAATHSGLAAGINDAFRQTGIAVGVAGLGALFPAQSVLAGGSATGFVDGLHTALYVSTAIALVGAVICLVTLPWRVPGEAPEAEPVALDEMRLAMAELQLELEGRLTYR
ncbi:MFS transporter [Spongisporangium articulatum]|uniref:MFS transporter n=1 Tax=Spongisporangium articulatum TaxID=3362603 RepID=A0ABW8AQP0_9ACTN